MGFFSGIGKAVKGVIGAIADPISSIAGVANDVLGIAGPFMESQSVANANAANAAASREQMAFQAGQSHLGRAHSAAQAEAQFWRNRELLGLSQGFAQTEAQKARDFSERMAGSQYQRAVADLSAAGLNPMLAVSQGGAAAPSGVAASAGSASVAPGSPGSGASGAMAVHRPEFVAQSLQSAASARVMASQVDNVTADTANKLLQATNIQADTSLKGSQSYQATTQGHVNKELEGKIIKTVEPLLDQIRASAEQSSASAAHLRSQNLLMKDLMENPVTRPFAPLLNIIFK